MARMDARSAEAVAAPGAGEGFLTDYVHLAKQPLHVLAFLAPLIVFYEFVALLWERRLRLEAERSISDLFGVFGLVGPHLPSILMVAVLVVWHCSIRERWRLRPAVLATMAGECVLWTLPLLVLGQVFFAALPAASVWGQQPPELVERLALAVGAGLFEELLFRLIVIAMVHALTVDLLGASDRAGWAWGVGVSALAFALAHHVPGGGGWGLRAYYAAAGLYLGVVFAARGLGVVVGVHVLYDVVALVQAGPNLDVGVP